jgi:hypothetical protein
MTDRPELRDPLADYRKALVDQIAIHSTPHLQFLLAELDALDAPPLLEHKAADPPPEAAVPRRPGRPRKHF